MTRKAAENWLEGLLASLTAGAIRFRRLDSAGSDYSMVLTGGKQEHSIILDRQVVEAIGGGSRNEQLEVETS